MSTTAIVDEACITFTMKRGTWSMTAPISDLPRWLAFYRSQAERFPDHAESYAPDIRALEALTRRSEPNSGQTRVRPRSLQT